MNMEGTAVLLSIRPEWCQKIFRGEKTMEIRKSFPKDFQGQPFKCFIYCTKGQNAGFRLEPDGGLMRLDAARLVVVSALVPILRQTAELAGFEIIGRIPLRDKATGKEYR